MLRLKACAAAARLDLSFLTCHLFREASIHSLLLSLKVFFRTTISCLLHGRSTHVTFLTLTYLAGSVNQGIMKTTCEVLCTALSSQPQADFNYLCQNSRLGHTVAQPRSFLATPKSSRFRGFRLMNSGATASFSFVSTSG